MRISTRYAQDERSKDEFNSFTTVQVANPDIACINFYNEGCSKLAEVVYESKPAVHLSVKDALIMAEKETVVQIAICREDDRDMCVKTY